MLIDREQLEFLVELQFSWTDIASLFGISRINLFRKRMELGIQSKYSVLDDEELLSQVSSINPLVAELFCHKLDLLEIVGFLCTFLQHAVC